jgi:hypothetical protein
VLDPNGRLEKLPPQRTCFDGPQRTRGGDLLLSENIHQLDGGFSGSYSLSLLSYLGWGVCGSGFGLNGVMSSSSRQITLFLNFQPCEVLTNVSS